MPFIQNLAKVGVDVNEYASAYEATNNERYNNKDKYLS
jgi:hypothetical protein